MDMSIRQRMAFRKMAIRHEAGNPIRVGFGVINESIFPLSRVFELMSRDQFFDPFIILLPDVLRERDHAIECYAKSCSALSNRYLSSKIYMPYDPVTDLITDYSGLCDLYATANPYELMNPAPYKSINFVKKNIPIFYAHYGTSIAKSDLEALRLLNYWRIFANTEMEYQACQKNGNSFLAGMSRMDTMASIKRETRKRKKIIIAPHHTIFPNYNLLTFSQFLRFADFFLELPSIFPEIDFCFRPHPLLVYNLQSEKCWGKEKTASWFEQLSSQNNMELELGGDFLQTFVNSDALIHDCGSFIADYMFTGHPCCYMFPEKGFNKSQYNEFGLECLDAHYSAINKTQIIDFINNVVLSGEDPLLSKRKRIFDRIRYKYPHNSEIIINNIRDEILNALH